MVGYIRRKGWIRMKRLCLLLLVVLLAVGLLDTPLGFLRDGLLNGLLLVLRPYTNLLLKLVR